VTRKQIENATWLNNFHAIPPELCGNASNPGPVWDFVFYRRLDNGRFQIIRICSPQAAKMFSVTEQDYNRLIEAARGVR